MINAIQILSFGKLTDILPAVITKEHSGTTVSSLLSELEKDYPALKDRTYRVSVNRKMADGETPVSPGDEIALMPPFSGG